MFVSREFNVFFVYLIVLVVWYNVWKWVVIRFMSLWSINKRLKFTKLIVVGSMA